MKCPTHNGQQTVIVCVTCSNKLLCPACIDDHTQGHSYSSLQKVASQIQQELKNLSARYCQYLSDAYVDIRATQSLQKDQEALERQACDKINAQRQLLHMAIDEFADNLLKNCKQRKDNNLSSLQDHEKLLSKHITEIDKVQVDINKIMEFKNFAEVIETSKIVKSIEPPNFSPITLEIFDFHTNEISKQSIDQVFGQFPAEDNVSDFVGSLQLQSPALSASQKASSDFLGSVYSKGGWTTVSTISNYASQFADTICPSVSGYAWVRWSGLDNVQLTDRQGHVAQTVRFNEEINGMTTTPDNRLLVCGWQNKCIYQVVYGSLPSVYFKTALYPFAVCIADNLNMFVSMVDDTDYTTTHDSKRIVSKHNNEGQQISLAEFDNFGDKLFVLPDNVTVNNTNTTVAVVNRTSAELSHLVLLDTSLQLKLRYDGRVTPANKKYIPYDAMFAVNDVAFSNDDNILVAEAHSNSIMLLDSDCQLLKTLWRDEEQPVSFCVCNDGELWCSFERQKRWYHKSYQNVNRCKYIPDDFITSELT